MLDVSCGTGYFTRRFADIGLHVSGIDPDVNMLAYAKTKTIGIQYVRGSAYHLPFRDKSFDYVTAITSLCFLENPQNAISEMKRVSRKSVLLGLLNQHSLLYKLKHGKGAYQDARWDTISNVKHWLAKSESLHKARFRTCVVFPKGHMAGRTIENLIPNWCPWGSFMAISF